MERLAEFLLNQARKYKRSHPFFSLGMIQMFWYWTWYQGIVLSHHLDWVRKARLQFISAAREIMKTLQLPSCEAQMAARTNRLVVLVEGILIPGCSVDQVLQNFLAGLAPSRMEVLVYILPYLFGFPYTVPEALRVAFCKGDQLSKISSDLERRWGAKVVVAPFFHNDFRTTLSEVIQELRKQAPRFCLYLGGASRAVPSFLCFARIAPIQFTLDIGAFPLMPGLNACFTWMHHHDDLRKILEESGIECRVLPVGIQVGESKKIPLQKPFLPSKFRKEESMRLVTVGNHLEARMNLCFCKLVAQALQSFPNASFWVVGRGAFLEARKFFREMRVADRVIFLGSREDVYALLPYFDIYLNTFPSGGGLALVEALDHKLPVLHIRQEGAVIKEAGNQYVGPFSCHDEREYMAFLRYLLRRRSHARAFGDAMFAFRQTYADGSAWIKEIIKWLQSKNKAEGDIVLKSEASGA